MDTKVNARGREVSSFGESGCRDARLSAIPREDLRNIKICARHAALVYHDERLCPCCRMQMEVVRGKRMYGRRYKR